MWNRLFSLIIKPNVKASIMKYHGCYGYSCHGYGCYGCHGCYGCYGRDLDLSIIDSAWVEAFTLIWIGPTEKKK